MLESNGEIKKLAKEFEQCQKILLAFGDENRQHMMLEMMQIQILKDAGILKMRREGTKNYYYFDADMDSINRLINMLEHAKQIMENLPDRSREV